MQLPSAWRYSTLHVATALLLPMVLGACGGGNSGDNESAAASDASSAAAAASPLSPEAAIVWTRIATEGNGFTVNGKQTVRYGSGTTWIERTITCSGWLCVGSSRTASTAPSATT